MRRLEQAGLGSQRKGSWREAFRFDLAAEGLDASQLPPRPTRRLALLERRGLDGRKLFAVRGEALAAAVGSGDAAAVMEVWNAWKREYRGRFAEPGQSGACWLDERL